MKPLKYPLKRTAAVLAGSLLGLVGAVALTAPASAHDAPVTGTTACTQAGDWTVTWKIVNSEADKVGTVNKVVSTPAGKPVSTIVVGAQIPAGGELIGTQALSKDDATATLDVSVGWTTDGYPTSSSNSASVNRPANCPPTTPTSPKPSASPSATPTPKIPGEGGGDTLPKTGVAVGDLVGGAALLLALGIGLFLLARRRRVTFPA